MKPLFYRKRQQYLFAFLKKLKDLSEMIFRILSFSKLSVKFQNCYSKSEIATNAIFGKFHEFGSFRIEIYKAVKNYAKF